MNPTRNRKMETNIIISIALVLPLSLASCGKDKDSADGSAPAGEPAAYPLSTCVVSGEELGSMGKAIEYDHEGTTVKFCCKACIPKFEKDPAKYLAKLKK
jgi:YHS domain-containing protein